MKKIHFTSRKTFIKKGDKKKKTEWMQKLNTIRNQNFHSYSVTEEEITTIKAIKKWLIKDI